MVAIALILSLSPQQSGFDFGYLMGESKPEEMRQKFNKKFPN